jgi:hypothetical protein
MSEAAEASGLAPSVLRVNVQGSWLSGMKPSVKINGYLVACKWGPTDFQMPPGRHRVSASAQWMRTYGQAELDVDLPPGQVVEVFYASPPTQFQRGSMGLTRRSRVGTWVFAGVLAVLVVAAFALSVAGA